MLFLDQEDMLFFHYQLSMKRSWEWKQKAPECWMQEKTGRTLLQQLQFPSMLVKLQSIQSIQVPETSSFCLMNWKCDGVCLPEFAGKITYLRVYESIYSYLQLFNLNSLVQTNQP